MHKAASAVVEWASILMKGRDTTKMSIHDTGLGNWIPRQENTMDQGQHGEMGTIMEQGGEHHRGKGRVEDSTQVEDRAGGEQAATVMSKAQAQETKQ